MINNRSQANLTLEYKPFSKALGETVKTGIIRSNMIAVFTGLCMALYVYDASIAEHWLAILASLVGSSFIIGAAGAFNNLYDRDIDAVMERTRNRPTVTGQVDTRTGLALGIFLTVAGTLLLLFASPMAALFALLGLFLYMIPYTMWTKRRTVYNTEVGSISGAVPPLIGWSVISHDYAHAGIWALVITMILWQMPHFYCIAIRRFDEYKAAGVPMLPVVKGIKRAYTQSNVYLVLLSASSFLFWSFSPIVAVIVLLINLAWLVTSFKTYNPAEQKAWATKMFIFSIQHLILVYLVIVLYSLIAKALL
ncbi:heme o synthase [Paenibacillus sp. JSM ZJ436]|uniref:heme o synthase n=1 Tax=Paenibacillus sp. JSM ZJ436 TaxID=3376190 RepID=UPI0037B81E7E